MASKKATITGVGRPKTAVSHTPVQKPAHGSVKPAKAAVKLAGGRTPSTGLKQNYPKVPDASGKVAVSSKISMTKQQKRETYR